jgi:hypothetical protein
MDHRREEVGKGADLVEITQADLVLHATGSRLPSYAT